MLIISERKTTQGKEINGREVVKLRLVLAVRYLSPLRKLIAKGYGQHNKKSAFNRAVADVIRYAITGEYPDFKIDPSLVKLTRGGLLNPLRPRLSRTETALQLNFDSRIDDIYGFSDDQIVLCAYNPEHGIAGINDEKCYRADGRLGLQLPVQLASEPVHVYLFAHDRDEKHFSRSEFLGTF
jgi:hypothetical protein